jgi:hypothetical protein
VPLPAVGLVAAIVLLWNRAVGPLDAFPTSAFHGLSPWERVADPTGLLIALFEKLGIVWNVVRVSPERQRAKALAGRA